MYLREPRHHCKVIEEGAQDPSPSSVSSAELHSFWSLGQWHLKIDAVCPGPGNKSWFAKQEAVTCTSSTGDMKEHQRARHSPEGQPQTQTPVQRGKGGTDRRKPSCQKLLGPWADCPQLQTFILTSPQPSCWSLPTGLQTCWFWLLT